MSARNSLPEWVWSMADAAADASLQVDDEDVPESLRQAWERLIGEGGSEIDQRALGALLKTCKPADAHNFLAWAGSYDCLTAEFNIVLRRSDCDRATALMYFAWFWMNYHDGERQWMEDDQHELMCYIRTRAWNGDYKARKFDVPEGTLLELAEMRKTLVDNKDHPYSLPASFVTMSAKEELYYKVVEKLIPRRNVPERGH